MGWTTIHKTTDSNGRMSHETGYWTETIDLGNNADASTSSIPFPLVGDFTVLIDFSAELNADTWIQIEHSINGTDWFKTGHSGTEDLATTNLTGGEDPSKIVYIDVSRQLEVNGLFFTYNIATHGMSKFIRFTVKANGQNESGCDLTFYVVPHNL